MFLTPWILSKLVWIDTCSSVVVLLYHRVTRFGPVVTPCNISVVVVVVVVVVVLAMFFGALNLSFLSVFYSNQSIILINQLLNQY